ncbi:MAG: hypothetical protein LBH65_04380, partial [Desulfovibrio sp.]|nr:hypothetical protein [Desulfovibrio sp.]
MTEKKKTARDKGLRLHKAGHDPRAAALEVLYRVRYAHEDSQTALNDALSREGFSIAPSDKALCTELVYGALRHYPRLRRFAYRFLTRPDKLPEEMRLLLLQTLYEMAYLRIPHHAGVNWAVGHVRHRFGKGLAGVANGALRSMQRELRDYYEPDKPGGTGQGQDTEKPDERLAWRYAMPLWIVRLWRERYGLDHAERLLSASATAPPSGLRLNRGKADWEKTRAQLLGRD